MIICFRYVGKGVVFVSEGAHLPKNLKFCRKKSRFFAVKKQELVNKYIKRCKKMVDSEIRARYLWAT